MDVLAPYLAGEYKDEQTYSKLYSTLMSENIMSIGQIIDKKLYDKSIDALSKYPTWPHAERSKKGKRKLNRINKRSSKLKKRYNFEEQKTFKVKKNGKVITLTESDVKKIINLKK